MPIFAPKIIKNSSFLVWFLFRDPEALIPGFRDAENHRDPGISGSREIPMKALCLIVKCCLLPDSVVYGDGIGPKGVSNTLEDHQTSPKWFLGLDWRIPCVVAVWRNIFEWMKNSPMHFLFYSFKSSWSEKAYKANAAVYILGTDRVFLSFY